MACRTGSEGRGSPCLSHLPAPPPPCSPPCKIHTVYIWRILQGGAHLHHRLQGGDALLRLGHHSAQLRPRMRFLQNPSNNPVKGYTMPDAILYIIHPFTGLIVSPLRSPQGACMQPQITVRIQRRRRKEAAVKGYTVPYMILYIIYPFTAIAEAL